MLKKMADQIYSGGKGKGAKDQRKLKAYTELEEEIKNMLNGKGSKKVKKSGGGNIQKSDGGR